MQICVLLICQSSLLGALDLQENPDVKVLGFVFSWKVSLPMFLCVLRGSVPRSTGEVSPQTNSFSTGL